MGGRGFRRGPIRSAGDILALLFANGQISRRPPLRACYTRNCNRRIITDKKGLLCDALTAAKRRPSFYLSHNPRLLAQLGQKAAVVVRYSQAVASLRVRI